jgi:hypothetical protein
LRVVGSRKRNQRFLATGALGSCTLLVDDASAVWRYSRCHLLANR